MERRTRAYALIALLLAGCSTTQVEPPNEYRIALKELPAHLLTRCEGLGDKSDNQVGTLLQDFVDLSAVATPCRGNHNDLVDYLEPLVEKAKSAE